MFLLLSMLHHFHPYSDIKDPSKLMVRSWEGTWQRFTGPSSGLSLNTKIFFSQFQELEKERSFKFDIFQNAHWEDTYWKRMLLDFLSFLQILEWMWINKFVLHISEINTIMSGTPLYIWVHFEYCDLDFHWITGKKGNNIYEGIVLYYSPSSRTQNQTPQRKYLLKSVRELNLLQGGEESQLPNLSLWGLTA